jgi:hypothetical protein
MGFTTPPVRVAMVLSHSLTCTTRYGSVDAHEGGDSNAFWLGHDGVCPLHHVGLAQEVGQHTKMISAMVAKATEALGHPPTLAFLLNSSPEGS